MSEISEGARIELRDKWRKVRKAGVMPQMRHNPKRARICKVADTGESDKAGSPQMGQPGAMDPKNNSRKVAQISDGARIELRAKLRKVRPAS